MKPRRLAPNGEVADWQPLEIEEVEGEAWNRYHLGDGSIIKTKTILSGVVKAKNQQGETIYDEDGEPYYKVQFDSIVELEEEGDSESD